MPQTKTVVSALAAAVGLLLASPAPAGTQLLTYDGPDAIKQGHGGEKKVVDGVDFWLSGSPPRRFQVLGSIEDERHKTGLFGALSMSGLENDIARQARSAGGDAVILTDAHDNLQGYVGTGFGSAYGSRYGAFGSVSTFSRPVESHSSRYVVVKYLPDGAAPAWSDAAPPPLDAEAPTMATRF